jgi:hypothetical protein
MTTLIVGASGATGKLLVDQLLDAGHLVKVIVRSTTTIPAHWHSQEKLTIIQRNISEITVDEMSEYVAGCQAVASCLGHTMSWKGIYGKPRKLVTDSVRLLCEAMVINAPEEPTKLVLMNTAGNSNRDLTEPISTGQGIVIALLRLFLPPHSDNETAADFLRVKAGQNHPYVEWVVVRPDNLLHEEEVTEYSLHQSPTRSAIFDPGQTSRINVGHFMKQLIVDEGLWKKWKGQMPVIYNTTAHPK